MECEKKKTKIIFIVRLFDAIETLTFNIFFIFKQYTNIEVRHHTKQTIGIKIFKQKQNAS